eukprot:753388-Hanusia_phi.AAC.9
MILKQEGSNERAGGGRGREVLSPCPVRDHHPQVAKPSQNLFCKRCKLYRPPRSSCPCPCPCPCPCLDA